MVYTRNNVPFDEPNPTDPTGGGGLPTFPIPPTGGGSPTINPAPNPTPPTNNPPVYFQTPTSPYRGLQQITTGGTNLINAINSIFASYRAGNLSLQDAILNATQLQGYLSNSSVFYQAQHGDDASALVRFRMQAYNIIAAIRNWVTPPATNGPPTGTNPPQDCLVNCDGSDSPTSVPVVPDWLSAFIASLTPAARTSVEAPPNLFSYNPSPDGSGSQTSGGFNMRNIAILVVVAIVGYYLYKKYA